jgi:signal transduction histidine kinase
MDLRPTMLDELGLIPTLRWYVQNFSKRLGIDSQFRAIMFEEKLPLQIETAFYRIVQEALNNIAKHAEANHVEISLEQRDSTICVSIVDNGRGFDLDRVLHPESPERGFGIIGMQERISRLGGKMDIQSRLGFGTRIYIEVPYRKGSDDPEKDTCPAG